MTTGDVGDQKDQTRHPHGLIVANIDVEPENQFNTDNLNNSFFAITIGIIMSTKLERSKCYDNVTF